MLIITRFNTVISCVLLTASVFIVKSAAAQPSQRSIKELTADQSGWDMVNNIAMHAKNPAVIFPAMKDQATATLLDAQVSTRSAMGAIIYFTGGVIIDNGWLRLLGSGSTNISRSIIAWNKGKTYQQQGQQPQYLLVADDAAGGFFAINGGGLGADAGKVYYLSPDTLQWESLGISYSEFLDFCFNGDLDTFYKNLRWKNWKLDMKLLNGDQVFNFYPYLWSAEGKDINQASKKVVPVEEQYLFTIDNRKQLGIK